jgi:hypothetical protein
VISVRTESVNLFRRKKNRNGIVTDKLIIPERKSENEKTTTSAASRFPQWLATPIMYYFNGHDLELADLLGQHPGDVPEAAVVDIGDVARTRTSCMRPARFLGSVDSFCSLLAGSHVRTPGRPHL